MGEITLDGLELACKAYSIPSSMIFDDPAGLMQLVPRWWNPEPITIGGFYDDTMTGGPDEAMIVDLSRAETWEVNREKELIDVTPIGATSREYALCHRGPEIGDDMIVDLGGMIPSLNNAGILAKDIRMEYSAYDHTTISLEGYLMPAREGHMYGQSQCHLCHAPLVNQRTETQRRFKDKKHAKGRDAQVEEKTVLVQTYECGTEVIRDTQKRADEVTIGPKCIKFKEAK